MQPARIAELLQPFLQEANDPRPANNDSLCHNISTYIDILLRWNARINLTAIRDPEQIVTRHFGESLFAARHLFPTPPQIVWGQPPSLALSGAEGAVPAERSSAVCVADLGTGAGFPGLPIKLWAPHIRLTLIESNHKKAAFLREIVRVLTLTNVNVLNDRAEDLRPPLLPSSDLTHGTGVSSGATHIQFDVITLRAVERFVAMLPIVASLLAPAGRLAFLIGLSQVDPAQATLPHFSWNDPIPVPQSIARCLLLSHAPNQEL